MHEINDLRPEVLPRALSGTDESAVRVSVIVPMYNASAYIETSLASVAGQSFRDIELIAIDDGSSDDTIEKATRFLAGSGLRHSILRMPSNGGPARARNLGVATARGKYIAFIDADDEWLPGKLASQVALMDSDPTITLCGCQALWVDSENNTTSLLFNGLPSRLPFGWKNLLWSCYVATPCALVRREDLGISPFVPSLRVGEDRHLWISLATNGSVALVQEVMVKIRVSTVSYMATHSSCIVNNTLPMIRGFVRIFSDSLSITERMKAIGSVYSNIGKAFCQTPAFYAAGAQYLLRAALLGHNPVDNLRFAILSAPGISKIKAMLKKAYH